MLKLSPYRLVVTINVNGLNSPVKKLEIVELDFKIIQFCAFAKRRPSLTGPRKRADDQAGHSQTVNAGVPTVTADELHLKGEKVL